MRSYTASARIKKQCLRFLALAIVLCAATAKKHHPHHTTEPTTAPTLSPTLSPTSAPTVPDTPVPTLSPTTEADVTTEAPTATAGQNATSAPTPFSSAVDTPTAAPTTDDKAATAAPTPAEKTLAPTVSPTEATAAPTSATPTTAPTASPTAASSSVEPPAKKRLSFLKILGKTIAWLIIIALSVVAFGAIMSNRYRIYFFLRGVWYTISRMECTMWIKRKLRLGDSMQVDTSLNTIIFDNEMTEGLLMREDN